MTSQPAVPIFDKPNSLESSEHGNSGSESDAARSTAAIIAETELNTADFVKRVNELIESYKQAKRDLERQGQVLYQALDLIVRLIEDKEATREVVKKMVEDLVRAKANEKELDAAKPDSN